MPTPSPTVCPLPIRTSRFPQVPEALRAALTLVSLALAASTLAPRAMAQPVAGVGDDAIPIPHGGFRFLVGGLWNDYRAVFAPGDGKRELFATLGTDRFGTTQLPQLQAAESSIRALSGDSRFSLSLGALEAQGEVRQSIAPFTIDYGVTRRLSLRVLVPYVESRDATQFILNRAGRGANVGRNPAFVNAASRATNGAVLTQIETARAALVAQLTRCVNTTATGCDAIRANVAGAQGLVNRALQTSVQLRTVYGNAERAGSPVVPLVNSTQHAGVLRTIDALRTDFGAYGITSIAASAAPAAAPTVLGPASMTTVASDTSFGVGYERLGDTRRAGIGDVDLTATFLVFDTFQADQVRRLLTPTRGIRSNVSMGWRFGTAGADRTEDAFDVPIGEGANALLVRSTTDLMFNRRAWVSATVRAVHPIADRVNVLLPDRDEATAFLPVGSATAARALGNRLEVELAPRYAVGQFFGVSAAYLWRHWGADRFDVANAEGTALDASSWKTPSRSLSAAAVGVTFSTLASYTRGRSRFPAEVIYTHTTPLSGSGGVVPAVSSDRLELRVYTGFPRR
ncbi:hypothetical protein [Gemmatimonas sp.]|uniref:hypothetical protein n=1 Tax=Gemmatimonas sp. TaxID=1962908 RepID=UPI00391C0F04